LTYAMIVPPNIFKVTEHDYTYSHIIRRCITAAAEAASLKKLRSIRLAAYGVLL
jgi:hypothetical protein